MEFPFTAERGLFPILAHKAQLSSCSQSALADPVAQAMREYADSWRADGMDWNRWLTVVRQAKAEFASLIHADAADIAVLSSVSDIASSIGSALAFPAEKNGIVLGEIDFPSLGHVWLAQQRKGARVSYVSQDGGNCISLDAYRTAIDARTCLVSVSHVSYYNGFIQDIRSIAELARGQGALLFVDAYQSAGAMPIDVVRDGIDMLASGAQKFLLGCPGIAFVYIRRDLAQKMFPGNTGWFGRIDPFAFDIHTLDFAEGAARFETGTPPILNAFAASAGMRLLNSLDMAAVESYLRHLSEVALKEAGRLHLAVASPLDLRCKASNTAIYAKDAGIVERRMRDQGYIVSARNDVIRIAPHFYNTEHEVVAAIRALAACL